MKRTIIFLAFFVFNVSVSFAGVTVLGDLSRQNVVSPGEKVEGVIVLKNNDSEAFQAKVYKTDYIFFADGKTIYGEPGGLQRSNANWISIKPAQLTIPPHETGSVYYTIDVPQKADLNGSYWSMIMIESVPSAAVKSLMQEKGKIKMGVLTLIRYGIQIVTDIEDSGKRNIRFMDKKLISEGSRKFLQLDIENTGERWLSPAVWLELYDKEGKSMGRLESAKLRVYPGCSARHQIDLTDVPKGKYKGLVVVDGGDQNVFGAQYDFEIK